MLEQELFDLKTIVNRSLNQSSEMIKEEYGERLHNPDDELVEDLMEYPIDIDESGISWSCSIEEFSRIMMDRSDKAEFSYQDGEHDDIGFPELEGFNPESKEYRRAVFNTTKNWVNKIDYEPDRSESLFQRTTTYLKQKFDSYNWLND